MIDYIGISTWGTLETTLFMVFGIRCQRGRVWCHNSMQSLTYSRCKRGRNSLKLFYEEEFGQIFSELISKRESFLLVEDVGKEYLEFADK